MKKYPDFFIIGCPRSGTTLLAKMLDSHSNVTVPDETGFLYYAYKFSKKFHNKFSDSELDQIFQNRKIEESHYHKFKTENEFLKKFVNHYKNESDKLLGEKTPRHCFYLDLISKKFPKSKVIFIVRNPVCVINSYQKYKQYWFPFKRAPKLLKCNIIFPALVWLRSVENYEKYKDKLSTKLIKYEDLVSDPDESLLEICKFLNVDYQPKKMKHFYKNVKISETVVRREADKKAHTNLKNPINKNRLYARECLSKVDIHLTKCLLYKIMKKYNYLPKSYKEKKSSYMELMIYIDEIIYNFFSLFYKFKTNLKYVIRNELPN